MSNLHYVADSVSLELAGIIHRLQEDQQWYEKRIAEATETGAGENRVAAWKRRVSFLQNDLVTLQAVQRRLELTNDITMSCIAEDLAGQILEVRKDPCADQFVGRLAYYETIPQWKWREDGRNMIACIGNKKGWPYGAGYTLGVDGNGFVVWPTDKELYEHYKLGARPPILGGRIIEIPCNKQWFEEQKR